MNKIKPLDQVSSTGASALNHTVKVHKIFESRPSIMQRLIDFASSVPDFRRPNKGNFRHRLDDIIILMILGRASGHVGRADIIEFGRHNINRFRKMRMFRNGIPSEATLCRVENGINDLVLADRMQEFAEVFHAELLKSDGDEKAKSNPNHRGDEEYNYFLAVAFPASYLKIIDYNRVVKDLNGLTPDRFIERLKENFEVKDMGTDEYRPDALHNFSLYLDGRWYSLTALPGRYNDSDPIGVLDVTISSDLILRDILGITDLRSDKRIDFVGGIRGLGELKRRVDSGEMAMALALYPVSMKQLMDIADSGNIMPPKTTWFEPKLRSGLVIHKLD